MKQDRRDGAEEVGAGYTFFCMGQPVGQPRQAGIGFAIRTALISQLEQRRKAYRRG